jgi:hypothetical protein
LNVCSVSIRGPTSFFTFLPPFKFQQLVDDDEKLTVMETDDDFFVLFSMNSLLLHLWLFLPCRCGPSSVIY